MITSGCLLSLYSSFGCDFVELEVGFTPSNQAWNQSSAHLGLFYMRTGKESGNKYEQALLQGCEWYSDSFEFNFIEGDRTWKVARIMALISGAASITATMTSWLFLFSPLPVSLFWPGLLLPAVLVAFLAEGSKFLMFDTAVCRTALWTPTGVDSLPQRAESCNLGSTAVYAIVSGSILFIALMFVCLKAPEKRHLDENYGRKHDNKGKQQPEDVESQLSGVNDYESQGSYPRGSDVYIVAESVSHTDRSVDYESVGGRSNRSGHSSRSRRSRASGAKRTPSHLDQKTIHSEGSHSDAYSYSQGGRRRGNRDGRESKSAGRFPDDGSREGVTDPIDLLKQQSNTRGQGGSADAGFDDRMTAAEIAIRRSEQQRISESRVSKIEKMERSSAAQSEDLIEKFVSDLNLSFQQDEAEGEGSSLEMTSSVLNLGKGYNL